MNAMTGRTLNRESLRWLVLEGLAIVVSILLAFWINAWLDDHQRDVEERLLLTSIESELKAIRDTASQYLISALAIRKNVSRLIELSYGAKLAKGEDVFKEFGDSMWRNSPIDYSAPVLAAVVAGGNISIVSNTELRLKLISWSTRRQESQYVVEHESRVLSDRQIPAFGKRDLLVGALRRSLCMPERPNACTRPLVETADNNFPDNPRLLLDVELRGVLSQLLLAIYLVGLIWIARPVAKQLWSRVEL